jgi:hypothetical protein
MALPGNTSASARVSGSNADLARLRQAARPDDLRSLRRLSDALRQAGRLVDGRPVQAWIDLFSAEPYDGVSLGSADSTWALEPERLLEGGTPEPVRQVVSAGPAAVPALVDALRTAARGPCVKAVIRTIVHSVNALARIRPVPTCAIPAVLESVSAASPKARAHILFELAGPLRPRATALAVRVLTDCLGATQEDRVRATAAQALSRLEGDLPARVRDAALAGLADPHRWVRHFCLLTLARLRGPDGIVRAALCEQYRHHEEHRPEVIRALLRFDEGQALAHLADELRRRAPGEAGRERYGRCLRLLEELGSLAVPVLSAVRPRGPVEEACVRAVLRGELKDSAAARARAPEPLADERTARLLTLPDRPGLAPRSRVALLGWVDTLGEDDRELGARAALAAVRRVAFLYDMGEDVRAKAEGVEQWIVGNGRRGLRAQARAGAAVPPLVEPAADGESVSAPRSDINPYVSAQRDHVLWAAESMAWVVESPVATWEHVTGAVNHACLALAASMGPVFRTITVEAPWYEGDAVSQIRQAIVDELLPWATGTWDPIADVLRRREHRWPVPAGQDPPDADRDPLEGCDPQR